VSKQDLYHAGVAGNVAAIFVSRISTALHGAKEERYMLTASTLFCITTPILIAFLAFVWVTEQARVGLAFTFTYSMISLILVSRYDFDKDFLIIQSGY
jgi:solute carrier family 41